MSPPSPLLFSLEPRPGRTGRGCRGRPETCDFGIGLEAKPGAALLLVPTGVTAGRAHVDALLAPFEIAPIWGLSLWFDPGTDRKDLPVFAPPFYAIGVDARPPGTSIPVPPSGGIGRRAGGGEEVPLTQRSRPEPSLLTPTMGEA